VSDGRANPKASKRGVGSAGGALAGGAVVLALKGLFWAIALAMPLCGAWLLSSLAAYANGPTWLAVLALFGLFPILPAVWEGLAAYLRSRKKLVPAHILMLSDRLLLRTLALNAVFLIALLAAAPETGVRALLARGDWMLDGATSESAEKARKVLFAIADRFEWVYRASRERSAEGEQGKKRKGDEPPEPLPSDDSIDEGGKPGDPSEPKPKPPPAPAVDPTPIADGHTWPYPEVLAPSIVGLEPGSIKALGEAIKNAESEPFARAKAVHDWVSDRVTYDVEALTGHRPPQDAETVFRSRFGVCAGYANLFLAVAKAADLEAVVVGGAAKGASGEVDGRGHAWNAVKLNGGWYLIDTTWDSGAIGSDKRWSKKYGTNYLFTPPHIMRATHFPDEEKWQIVAPITRGEFMRMPQLSPDFYRRGLKLVSPDRSQTSVSGTADIVIQNPAGQFVMAHFTAKNGGASTRCEVTGTATLTATCDFADDGEYRVVLFGAAERYTTYWSMGELQFLRKR